MPEPLTSTDAILELVIADEEAVLPDDAEGHVEVWREHGRVCAYGYQARGHNWLHLPRLASFRFLRPDDPVVGMPAGDAGGTAVRDAFERTALPLALQSLGRQVLHASAFGGRLGVVAICGDSGSGKSTLAYAAGRRGHTVWADDAVAFDVSGVGVLAIPLPFRVMLRPESAAFFRADSDEGGRRRPAPADVAPLAAVVVLERDARAGSGVTLTELSGADAFAAALSQGYCYRPTDGEQNARMVLDYLELAARVPVMAVRFEPRFESLAIVLDAIDDVLDGR